MGPFEKYRVSKIIKNYNNKFFEALNNNIDNIIEAFTKYYGEKYRNMISEKIKSTYFFTFISNNIIDLMKTGYKNLDSLEKDSHKDFLPIIKYYKKKKKFFELYENNGTLKGDFKKIVINMIHTNDDSCAFQLSNMDINYKPIYTVFFGIGINDQTIIHELNHVITSSILAYTHDNQIELIEKMGITTSIEMDNGEALEEIINDKAAYTITDMFHMLGGNISNFDIYAMETYPQLFPLIDRFYYKYYDLIKTARITDNQNILFSKIDKSELMNYQNFITDELNYITNNHQISYDAISKANYLIKKMDKVTAPENFEDYITELQKQKKLVKVLQPNKR